MAKGIEDIVNRQMQLGFLQKLKRRLSRKALTYGLAFSLLFPLARMASADTIYQKTHELKFLSPGVIYGKKQNPTTALEVKVDCDKVAEKEYELKLSFFADEWGIRKDHIEDYVIVNNILSNFYLVYPEEVALGEPKESAYLLSMKHDDKKIGGEWKDLAPLELSPVTQLKLGLLKIGTKIVSASLGFLLGGPVGAGAGLAGSSLGEAIILGGDVNEAKRKAMLVNAYGGTVLKIPFYPVDKDISARTFTIPIEVKDQTEKEIELNMLLDVGLKRGIQNEEYGLLRDLLVKVPLRESINYNVDNKEVEESEKGVEEERQIAEEAAEKQPKQTEVQAIKKGDSLEVKVASEPARGELNKSILGNLEKKVEDNIRDQYDIIIFDWDSNKTTLDNGVRAYEYSEGWNSYSGTLRYINVKKGGGELTIPFSKIESIEFLEKEYRDEKKVKVSFWDGNHIEFIYLPHRGESWEGKATYGDFVTPFREVRKITFLREALEPKTEAKQK